jgi:hypothetical protein
MSSQRIDPDDLPRKVAYTHDDDSPWYEYDDEPLFGDHTELVRKIMANVTRSDDVGHYSPQNGFRESTKIRTKDRQAFEEQLIERFNNVGEEQPFLTLDPSVVDVREEGPRKTIVRFSPSFGRPAFLGGAKKARQDIILEIKRYECDRFWEEVAEPLFEQFNEKYPY